MVVLLFPTEGSGLLSFIRSYADACLIPIEESNPFSGTWTLEDEKQIDIKQNKNIISTNWEVDSANYLRSGITKYKISGESRNRSATITYSSEFVPDKPQALGLLSIPEKKEIECFAYINDEGKKLYIMEKEGKEPFTLNLTKI